MFSITRCLCIISSPGWVPILTPDSLYATDLLVDYCLPFPRVLNHGRVPPIRNALANGIIYPLSSAFCFRTCIPYHCCWLYRFVKCPDGLTYASPNMCEPKFLCGSYSIGVTPDKIPHDNLIESEKWMKSYALKKWESTLNLCVHAHGYDLELIMVASCKDNYPLGVNSSCIYDWFLRDHGSYHGVPL